MYPCTFNVPCDSLVVSLHQDRTRHSSVDHLYRRQCLEQTFAQFFFSRNSWGVHDCRCQLRPLKEQLHFMFCCRSLRIFCTEVGRTVTVTITTPTNPNMTTPQIDVFTRTFFLCINVCLLFFVLGFSLTALTPEVKFASIFLLGNCSPFF